MLKRLHPEAAPRSAVRTSRSTRILLLACAFAVVATSGLPTTSEAEDRRIVIFTTEGSFTIRLYDDPSNNAEVIPYANAFFQMRGRLTRGFFHRSELLCDTDPPPSPLPDRCCTCDSDEGSDTFGYCEEDPETSCALCTCDESEESDTFGYCLEDPETSCLPCDCDESVESETFGFCLDDPDRECPPPPVIVTAPVLYSGLFRLDDENGLSDLTSLNPPPAGSGSGVKNDAGRVAFVREEKVDGEMEGKITSEWLINLEANNEAFDGVNGDGTDAHVVFGVVEIGLNVLQQIAQLSVFDASAFDPPLSMELDELPVSADFDQESTNLAADLFRTCPDGCPCVTVDPTDENLCVEPDCGAIDDAGFCVEPPLPLFPLVTPEPSARWLTLFALAAVAWLRQTSSVSARPFPANPRSQRAPSDGAR